MKNYIGFINDHSGSMRDIRYAALNDYNANIDAIKAAATREMQDTIVSVVGVGITKCTGQVERQVTLSNPHVLYPMTDWVIDGGTPLYDGIGNMIEMLREVPDVNKKDVSFLIMVTTDGIDEHSRLYSINSLSNVIKELQNTGKWTFVFRVPKKYSIKDILKLGVPENNIQQWETTDAGMRDSTVITTQAVDNYFTTRSSGATSSNSFYANASAVNVAALEDISSKVSLYVVPIESNGIEIRDFILKHRMTYLKGSAFYQLTKTEARVSHAKLILIRDRDTGKVFSGKDARKMIGLPTDRNARLHPGDHKNYDIFIQSESVNRKLVGGTGILYWKEIGIEFTEADLAYLKSKEPVKPEVVELPKVPVSTKPTKSPIPVTPMIKLFNSRKEAREYSKKVNRKVVDLGPQVNPRWSV